MKRRKSRYITEDPEPKCPDGFTCFGETLILSHNFFYANKDDSKSYDDIEKEFEEWLLTQDICKKCYP